MQIFNLEILNISYNKFFSQITQLKEKNIVFTPNPEMLLQAKKDPVFLQDLQKADYLTIDGIGLYIAFQMLEEKSALLRFLKLPYYFYNLFFRKKHLYKKYGERICGSDLTQDLLYYFENKKIKITILDLYNPNDIKKTESQKIFSEKLVQSFPDLVFDYIIYNPAKKTEITEQIAQSGSQVVFSTLGMKKQEKSIIHMIESCPNIKLGLAVGSSFDYFI